MTPRQDMILDALSDGVERTVDEIREAIGEEQVKGLHHTLASLRYTTAADRSGYRLRARRVRGRLYYAYGPRGR